MFDFFGRVAKAEKLQAFQACQFHYETIVTNIPVR